MRIYLKKNSAKFYSEPNDGVSRLFWRRSPQQEQEQEEQEKEERDERYAISSWSKNTKP